MPSCSARSSSSLLVSPSSFASSWTRGFLGKEVPSCCQRVRHPPNGRRSSLAQPSPGRRSRCGAARSGPAPRSPSAPWTGRCGERRARSTGATRHTARHPDPGVYERRPAIPPRPWRCAPAPPVDDPSGTPHTSGRAFVR
jgi:hypothetical protein